MNILFFSRLYHPHIGGVEKHVARISRILIQKGHKVTVVTEKHSRGLKNKEIIEGVEVIRIPAFKEGKSKKFNIWRWLRENSLLIENADIVHCHDVFFWYLPFRFLYPFKKVFTTFHGYEDFPLKPKDIVMHKVSEKLSMGNICIGDFIPKWYSTKADFVSYGAVDLPKNEKVPAHSNGAVFIGRLDEQTGIKTYAEAVEIVRKKILNFDFLVIGDGKYKNIINKKNKTLNAVSNAAKYFQDYEFAFVSRYLSILEAIAAKRLVFAVYDNPIKEDYLRLAPFSKQIVIFSSPLELSSKLLYYKNHPKSKEEMIGKAYLWVQKQTWEKIVKTYLKLWARSL
jgi:glycosyltransferase involved in cell wall biosynthesis